jgi:hypothetical protein
MAKVHLKKVKAYNMCLGCYFFENKIRCSKYDIITCYHPVRKIYKKISESTAKKLLKSGWRVAK